ncbi:MAG TPA: LysM domain-containing protein [Verrucomicrobiae bacterium]|nr:LysM domain-containing protein [Verrucomicrobiae bacterium]
MAEAKFSTYTIKPGDNFYLLAKNLGVSLDQVVQANPGVDPDKLEVGQSIKLPPAKQKANPKAAPGNNAYGDSPTEGESFSGRNMDHVGVNIGGVGFEVKRVIDNEVPHEIHIILPKTEIHSVTHNPDRTVSETQIMISNIDIVHSPRQ